MTPRQQRRLEQKLARKAAKRSAKPDATHTGPTSESVTEPRPCQPDRLARFSAQGSGCVSEAKLSANRTNAERSHGPVTEIGKQIVSQNATRHGLTGKFHVLSNESQADFDELLKRFLECQKPQDQEEVELVHQMAEATWLSRRSIRLQDDCIVAIQSGAPEEQKQARKDLGLYMRYMTTHDRAYSRYATELQKRRSERRRTERGFVSQKLREATENRKKEMHEIRQSIEICKRERREIQNRIAAAKAERQLQNIGKKEAQTMAAAA